VGTNVAGTQWANGSVENSYATGRVTGVDYVGGLVGDSRLGTVTNSFWDIRTSGQASTVALAADEFGTGLATAAMKSITTFTGASWPMVSGWQAFNGSTQVWGISPAVNDGYPYLLWQRSSAPNVFPVFSSGITGSGVAGTASDVYTAVATDADGGTVAYSLAPAVAGFTIVSSTGVVSMGAGVAAGLYVLNVVASDGTASVTQTVTVTVTPAVSPPGGLSSDVGLRLDGGVGDSIIGAGVDYFLDGLKVGSAWSVTLRSTPQIIASGIVDSSGIVRGTAVIPAGLEAGWHSITLVGVDTAGRSVSRELFFELSASGVISAMQRTAPALPAAVLAETGSDIGGLSTGALALLMLGLLGVGFARRQGKGLLAS
jgi:hypothetical protein